MGEYDWMEQVPSAGAAPTPPSTEDEYAWMDQVAASTAAPVQEILAADPAPPPTTTPEDIDEVGTFSKIVGALDYFGKQSRRAIREASDLPFEYDKDDDAPFTQIIHGWSQHLSPGSQHSLSRADPGTLAQGEDLPEGFAMKALDVYGGLSGSVLSDPTTYLGAGALTKGGRAAQKLHGLTREAKLLRGEVYELAAGSQVARDLSKLPAASAVFGKTAAEQASKGQRALVSFMGQTVVPGSWKGSEVVFEGAGRLASAIGDTKTAQQLGAWSNRIFRSEFGLSSADKDLKFIERMTKKEELYAVEAIADNYGHSRHILNDAARKAGIDVSEQNPKLTRIWETEDISKAVRDGEITQAEGEQLMAFTDRNAALLAEGQREGLHVSELASERDLAYVAHIRTSESFEWLGKQPGHDMREKVSNFLGDMAGGKPGFAKQRIYDMPVHEINEMAWEKGLPRDIKFMDDDPVRIMAARELAQVSALSQRKVVQRITDALTADASAAVKEIKGGAKGKLVSKAHAEQLVKARRDILAKQKEVWDKIAKDPMSFMEGVASEKQAKKLMKKAETAARQAQKAGDTANASMHAMKYLASSLEEADALMVRWAKSPYTPEQALNTAGRFWTPGTVGETEYAGTIIYQGFSEGGPIRTIGVATSKKLLKIPTPKTSAAKQAGFILNPDSRHWADKDVPSTWKRGVERYEEAIIELGVTPRKMPMHGEKLLYRRQEEYGAALARSQGYDAIAHDRPTSGLIPEEIQSYEFVALQKESVLPLPDKVMDFVVDARVARADRVSDAFADAIRDFEKTNPPPKSTVFAQKTESETQVWNQWAKARMAFAEEAEAAAKSAPLTKQEAKEATRQIVKMAAREQKSAVKHGLKEKLAAMLDEGAWDEARNANEVFSGVAKDAALDKAVAKALGTAKAVVSGKKKGWTPAMHPARRLEGATKALEDLEGLSDDYVVIRKGPLKGRAAPPEVVEFVGTMQKALKDEKTGFSAFKALYDPIQNWWAAWSLTPRLSFHTRNLAGGVWQNFLAGDIGFKHYWRARYLATSAPDDLGKIAFTAQSGKTWTLGEVREAGKRLGIDKGHETRQFMAGRNAIGKQIQDRAEAEAGNTWMEMVKRTKGAALVPMGSPNANSNAWIKLGTLTGDFVESEMRWAHFLGKLEAGFSESAAAMSVKKFHFDYSELSDIEKKVLKRIFPFYSWSRNNLPLAVEQLVKKPQQYGAIQKMRTELEHGNDTVPASLLPKWAQKAFAIQAGRDKNIATVWTLANYIPAQDIGKVFDLDEFVETLVGMVSPVIKHPLEQIAGVDAFRSMGQGRLAPIRGLEGGEGRAYNVDVLGGRVNPRIAHFLLANVAVNEIHKWNPGGAFGAGPDEDRQAGKEAPLNLIPFTETTKTRLSYDYPTGATGKLLTGIKSYRQDLEREFDIRKLKINMKIRELKAAKRRLRAREDERGREEAQGKIEALRARLRGLRAAYRIYRR